MSRERDEAWVTVRELGDMLRLQAERALLESEGIEAEVLSLQDSMYPSLSRYRLVVRAESEARAREILKKRGDE